MYLTISLSFTSLAFLLRLSSYYIEYVSLSLLALSVLRLRIVGAAAPIASARITLLIVGAGSIVRISTS